MLVQPTWLRKTALLLALVFTLGVAGVSATPGIAWAQSTHKKNIIQRHPKIASVAAGYAAYKAAKTTGKNRAVVGQKKNFAQRHPILTGVAAGMATHHVIKKSNQNH